jgi:hypothetical protein
MNRVRHGFGGHEVVRKHLAQLLQHRQRHVRMMLSNCAGGMVRARQIAGVDVIEPQLPQPLADTGRLASAALGQRRAAVIRPTRAAGLAVADEQQAQR